jgi:colicin import membrane protein
MQYAETAAPQTASMIKSIMLHLLVLALLILAPSLHLPQQHEPQVIQAYVMPRRASPPKAVPPVVTPEPPRVVEPSPAPLPEPKPEPKPRPKAQPKPAPAPVKLPPVPVKQKLAMPPKPAPVKPAPAKPEPVKPAPPPKPLPPPKVQPKPVPPPLPEKPKPKPLKQQISSADIDNEIADAQKQADAVKQQQRLNDLRALQQESDASLSALTQSADNAIAEQYRAKVMRQIIQKWHRPLSAKNGMNVTLRIRLLANGDVDDVQIVKRSGDDAFDTSAVNAVNNASPLSVPSDKGVFNKNFRSMNFNFHPEDLSP